MSSLDNNGPGVGRRPKNDRDASEQASQQVPKQRSVEDPGVPDDSLIRQMSHGDESAPRESGTEGGPVVGYVDEHGMEGRPEEGTREYDKE